MPCSILVIFDMAGLVGTSHNLNRQFLFLSNTVVCDVISCSVVEVFQPFGGMVRMSPFSGMFSTFKLEEAGFSKKKFSLGCMTSHPVRPSITVGSENLKLHSSVSLITQNT